MIEKDESLSAGTGVILDKSEVAKRIVKLGILALVVTVLIIAVDLLFKLYLSSIILAVFALTLGIIIISANKGYYEYTKISLLISINLLLIVLSFAEGLDIGGYLFFILLLYVIPFIIEDTVRYKREAFVYLTATAVCFFICVLYADKVSPWQDISATAIKIKYLVNCASVVFLSGAFSYLSIHFEKKHAKALIIQKVKAEHATLARSRFLSNMGHELRTPLNGIIGAANLIDKKMALAEQEEYLNIVKYCSDHMLHLVNDILDFNKIEADKLELHAIEFNLMQVINNSILPYYNRFDQKGISLLTELDTELDKMVIADDLRIIQILNNLLSNALKFTEQGHVKLSAKVNHSTEQGMMINFVVEDTGIGIEEEDQQKIFESFEQVYGESQRKHDGTGLGLSISLHLLKLMNSKLEVQSTKGKGSKFYFSLELMYALNNKNTSTSKAENTDIAGKKVLIAEDNVINMLIAQKILTGWDADTTTAINGLEALNAVKLNPEFDIILLDLGMPVMDGYQAVKEIKNLYPHIPILAFTAALMDNEMHHSLLEMGFSDSILKPFKPQDLLSKIRRYAL